MSVGWAQLTLNLSKEQENPELLSLVQEGLIALGASFITSEGVPTRRPNGYYEVFVHEGSNLQEVIDFLTKQRSFRLIKETPHP